MLEEIGGGSRGAFKGLNGSGYDEKATLIAV
jgi:hypothetical protein